MKKNIPSEKRIREGIVGFSFAGVGKKAFISEVKGRYFAGYAIMKQGGVPGDLMGIKEKEDFKEAVKEEIEMNNRLCEQWL